MNYLLIIGRNFAVYIVLSVFSYCIKVFDRFRTSLSGNNKLFELAYLWILLFFHHRNV